MSSYVLYTGDGSNKRFVIPFPYIKRPDVLVQVNTITQYTPMQYTFLSDTEIEFVDPPAENQAVVLQRVTDASVALAQFHDGSILTEAELNLAVTQLLYLLQETRDYLDSTIGAGVTRLATTGGVGDGTAASVIDAVVAEILDSQLLADLQQRITDIDTNATTIGDQIARVDALIAGLTDGTFTLHEAEAREEADTLINQTIDLMGAKSDDGLSFVFDLDTVKVSPTESLGDRLSGLSSSLDTVQASVTDEASTRATADEALGTRVDGVLATANNNNALILQEQTARASADSSMASDIQTLQSSVGDNTASISTQQTVLNGVKAQYMLKLDVNGYVSGFGLYNSGGSSKFYVLADQFAVVTPGKSPVVPFAVDSSGVYMNDAYIRNLVVDKISGGAIKSTWKLDSTSEAVNGRIVLDTGSYMKVLGCGFGANNDLIEWFGPKMAVTSCTKANAITYVGTNGSAYFGGTLSAGTLYNAGQSTTTQINSDLVVGPFTSNGNNITVALSYTYARQDSTDGASHNFTAGSGTTQATVKLYRTIAGGSESLVGTWTYTGDLSILNEADAASHANWSISGSSTFTDTAHTTSDRTYRAVVTARSTQVATASGGTVTTAQQQNLSLVCTEQ